MTAPQTIVITVGGLAFVTLAIGALPKLRINRAAMALIGAGALLATGAITSGNTQKTVDIATPVLPFSFTVIIAVLELADFLTREPTR